MAGHMYNYIINLKPQSVAPNKHMQPDAEERAKFLLRRYI